MHFCGIRAQETSGDSNHLLGHGILENLIQALSRTFRHRFKDFQGPYLFSRTFQVLKIWKKNQGLSRTRKSLDNNSIQWAMWLDKYNSLQFFNLHFSSDAQLRDSFFTDSSLHGSALMVEMLSTFALPS